MNARYTRRSIGLIILLILIATGLRVVAIDHGFPDVNEEATPVRQAWEMWNWDTGGIDFNPRFFNYPALTFYVNWAAQAAYRLITEPTGLRSWGRGDELPLDLVLIGRVLSFLFTAALCAATYRLSRKLMPRVWATWAAVIVFWMPTLFHYSLLSIVDIPLALLSVLVLNALTAGVADRQRAHVWVGVLIGLAASCKYPGAVLAVPYLAGQLARHDWDVRRTLGQPFPWLAGLTTVVVFFAVNPFILLDFDTFYWHYTFERHHMAVGHFGRLNSPVSEYGWTLWHNLGPIALVAIIPGARHVAGRLNRAWIPSVVFAVVYPSFLLLWSTSFGHYLFPVLPILVILAVQGLRVQLAAIRRGPVLRFARLGLPLLAIFPLVLSTTEAFLHLQAPTARALARAWFSSSVEAGTILATEPGGPEIDDGIHAILLPMHTTHPQQANPVYHPDWYAPVDLFVVVESVESRYRAQAERFPDQMALYDHLEASWELATRVGRDGHGIRIYRNLREGRDRFASYPDTLYTRLEEMSEVLAGRFLDRLGSAYRDAGRLGLAASVYGRLVGLLPQQQDYALTFADILLSLDRPDLAIELLESRRDIGDDHLVASLHFLKAEHDSAAAAWMRYAETYPGNLQVRINLARILSMMGKSNEALAWYLEAIDGGVNDPGVYATTSALLRQLGEPDRARAIAAKGLDRWPDNPQLRAFAED